MSSSQDFSCIFCNVGFNNKEELQIHFRKHGDPKYNQNVKGSKSRSDESIMSSEKSAEDTDMVTCDVCSDVFATISKAITHKHKVHPDHDAKYFCPWCGKLFTMKHLYNKHIESSHDSKIDDKETGFHCDYCEVDFFIPSAMVYHNKFFHRQDTELAAIGQCKKLKLFKQELLQLYYCPFCGEEYYNKVNLHKHMGDDHIDENQSPEDVLRCSLCDAIFYHLDAYELHLTFHSSEDLYSEENEIIKDIIEYSLDAVPPLMEKIENLEPEDDAEATMKTLGIETFLQQAMDESVDNENSNGECVLGKKSKKRKKHKKSKKAAITLDEFLNMNKDVFGEGIDFQGIEEVPTKAVKKQLKAKPSQKIKVKPNAMPSTELDKLRMQGITIKTKSGKVISKLKSKKNVNLGTKPLSKIQNTANELIASQNPDITNKTSVVISKLLNQSNCGLKIKKCTQEDTSLEGQDAQSPVLDILTKITDDTKIENLVNNKDKSDFTCNEIKQTNVQCNDPAIEEQCLNKEIKNTNIENFSCSDQGTDNRNVGISKSKTTPVHLSPVTNEEEKFETNKESSKTPLNSLRNFNQSITIKPVISPKKPLVQTETVDKTVDASNDTTCKSKGANDNLDDNTKMNDNITCHKNSLSAIKHLSHLITVKSVNKIPKTTLPSLAKNVDLENIITSPSGITKYHSDENENTSKLMQIKGNNLNKESKCEQEPPKSLDALKNLSKHITVKSMSQNSKISKDVENEESEEEIDYMNINSRDIKMENTQADCLLSNQSPTFFNKSQPYTEVTKFENVSTLSNISKPLHISNQFPDVAKQALAQNNSVTCKSTRTTNVEKNEIITKFAKSNEEIETFNIEDSEEEEDTKRKLENVQKGSNTSNIAKSSELNSINALKNISKNINVKLTVQQSSSIKKEIHSSRDYSNELNNSETKRITDQPRTSKSIDVLKNLSKRITVKPTAQPISTNKINIPNPNKDESFKNIYESDKEFDDTEDISETATDSNSKVLKNLSKHITVKSTAKPSFHINKIAQSPVKKSYQPMSDEEYCSDVDTERKQVNVLKNLSKHITVKPPTLQSPPSKGNQNSLKRQIVRQANRDGAEFDNDDFIEAEITRSYDSQKHVCEKSKTLQNTLNSLSKHITIKSKSTSATVKESASQLKADPREYNSDSDSSIPNVQITELTDNDNIDDELHPSGSIRWAKNVIVESPTDSNSENDFSDYDNLEQFDIESKINATTLPKSISNTKNNNPNLKKMNVSKDVKNKANSNNICEPAENLHSDDARFSNFSKELSVRAVKPKGYVGHAVGTLSDNKNKIIEDMNQTVAKNVCTSNQSSTVNKAVTVKTLQTKTVIQEITTTVTKTIRTLNQTVKQEVRNSNQNITAQVRPQIPQNVKQNTQFKNYQGMSVKQSSPTVGTRIGSTIRPARPTIPIRPSNQVVPVRHSTNITRPNRLRMPVIKKTVPSKNNLQQPVIGQPLKISPHAMIQSVKRSTPDETTGPFSCFKKPKESLIPLPDIPEFRNVTEGEMNFSSSSQVFRSNFSTSSKIVKGESVAMSTTTKSDVKVSSEQLTRLSNMSGLKVTKPNQSKEITHSEKEITGSKCSTLEAIQKLQNQGLLVKKPRLNDIQYKNQSYSDEDANYDT